MMEENKNTPPESNDEQKPVNTPPTNQDAQAEPTKPESTADATTPPAEPVGAEPKPTPTAAPAPAPTPAPAPPVQTAFVKETFAKASSEIQKVIIGSDETLLFTFTGLFTGGHILLEGVPGVAKTLMSKLVSKVIGVEFQRIQFTPDLMPSDVIGTSVFNMDSSTFTFKRGPIFSNLILIDEINRSPAKTQAALIEVMEEQQVTVDGKTYDLDAPFFVLATQNPMEHEGTYRLPEAQLDRFTFKLKVEYPTVEEELLILERFESDFNQQSIDKVKAVVTAADVAKCVKLVEKVHIKKDLMGYIAQIVQGTRNNVELYMGASPRASLAIMKTSKGIAAIAGRDYVTPDDIQKVCAPVLRHRIILSPEKEMAGGTSDEVIKSIIQSIEVPR